MPSIVPNVRNVQIELNIGLYGVKFAKLRNLEWIYVWTNGTSCSEQLHVLTDSKIRRPNVTVTSFLKMSSVPSGYSINLWRPQIPRKLCTRLPTRFGALEKQGCYFSSEHFVRVYCRRDQEDLVQIVFPTRSQLSGDRVSVSEACSCIVYSRRLPVMSICLIVRNNSERWISFRSVDSFQISVSESGTRSTTRKPMNNGQLLI